MALKAGRIGLVFQNGGKRVFVSTTHEFRKNEAASINYEVGAVFGGPAVKVHSLHDVAGDQLDGACTRRIHEPAFHKVHIKVTAAISNVEVIIAVIHHCVQG